MTNALRKPTSISETRFSHFLRAAPASEKARVLGLAMKQATTEQRTIVSAAYAMNGAAKTAFKKG